MIDFTGFISVIVGFSFWAIVLTPVIVIRLILYFMGLT